MRITIIGIFYILMMGLIASCETNNNDIVLNREILNASEPLISVRIIYTLDEVKVKFHGKWKVENQPLFFKGNDGIIVTQTDGKVVVKDKSGATLISDEYLILKAESHRTELEIADVPFGVGWWWEGKENRKYEGVISFYPTPAEKPEVIVTLPMEEYLKGVVPYEIGGDSPPEALKAQAVAARSEAVIALKSDLYRGPNHDLTSDVECQVFSGNNRRTQYSDEAVDATRGIILTSEGKPINAYYASNCGGHSELIKNVWPDRPSPEPYTVAGMDAGEVSEIDLSGTEEVTRWIESKPDVYCNPANGVELPSWSKNNFRWEREYEIAELQKMMDPENQLGAFSEIKVLKRGVSGRIIRAEIVFEKGNINTATELELRQLFQPSLRSSCFITEKHDNRLIIKGAGWGHGVGMCQSGAVSMAERDADFKDILGHYYRYSELNFVY